MRPICRPIPGFTLLKPVLSAYFVSQSWCLPVSPGVSRCLLSPFQIVLPKGIYLKFPSSLYICLLLKFLSTKTGKGCPTSLPNGFWDNPLQRELDEHRDLLATSTRCVHKQLHAQLVPNCVRVEPTGKLFIYKSCFTKVCRELQEPSTRTLKVSPTLKLTFKPCV